MPCSKPVETATNEEFLNAPVANAFGAPSKIPTSGMPICALSASLRTVSTIQASSAFCGSLMTRTPELHLATGLLISSEIMAPPKPMTAANPSNMPRFKPCGVRYRFTPSRLATMPSTTTTARLVITNKIMRFMNSP